MHSLNLFSSFSYYIAGSGGVGPTTLASSFLLLGEDVITYNKGTFDLYIHLCCSSVWRNILGVKSVLLPI